MSWVTLLGPELSRILLVPCPALGLGAEVERPRAAHLGVAGGVAGGGAGRGHAPGILGRLQVLDRVVLLGLAVGHLDVLEVLGQLVHVGHALGSTISPAHPPDPRHQGVASWMTLRSLGIKTRSRVMMTPLKNVI